MNNEKPESTSGFFMYVIPQVSHIEKRKIYGSDPNRNRMIKIQPIRPGQYALVLSGAESFDFTATVQTPYPSFHGVPDLPWYHTVSHHG